MGLVGFTVQGFTSRAPLGIAAQILAAAVPPPIANAAIFIQRVGEPLTAVAWDPSMPVPEGYELVSGRSVGETRSAIERGTMTTSSRAQDVSVTPLSPLSAQRREAQRQQAEARAAARRERREQLKKKRADAFSVRVTRSPRVSRPARKPRASRPPRRPRPPRLPRSPRRPRSGKPRPFTRKRVKGLCKFSDATGGCWNAGTCGPSPTGGPGKVGHCIFEASEDCNACQQGACSAHGRGLISKMLALLPSSWQADPAHREKALTEQARKRATRQRRRLALPAEVSPAASAFAPSAPAPTVPHAAGCPHGTGLCCGLTGFRCGPPGPGCGACSNAQRTAAAAAGLF